MSDFKSKIEWPASPENLPTYKGEPPGKAGVRKAEMEAGGMDGTRRVDWTDEKGNSYIMNTRKGFPVVETVSAKQGIGAAPQAGVRGWLIRIRNAARALLFSPYSLAVQNANYSPPKTCYSVLPFTTTYNVEYPDMMHWGDIVSFVTAGTLVNGRLMLTLGIVGSPSSRAIPWLIPKPGGSGVTKYGDAIDNATTKRVFAVYRESVHSFFPATPDAVLNGGSFRGEGKALVCGQRIDAATHTAWLHQLVFTGNQWDSLGGGWGYNTAEIAMMLTPPYLTKVANALAAEQPICSLAPAEPDVGTSNTEFTAPETEFCLVSNPGTQVPELMGSLSSFRKVRWFWNGKYNYSFLSNRINNYSKSVYSGTESVSGTLAGRAYSVTMSNEKKFGSNTESISSVYQVPAIPTPSSTTPQASAISPILGGSYNAIEITWDPATDPTGTRGLPPESAADWYGSCAGSATYTSQEQVGAFSIIVDAIPTVTVTFSRTKETGNAVVMHGTTNQLDPWLGLYSGSFSGFGIYNYLDVAKLGEWPYAYDQLILIPPALEAKADEWTGTTVIDSPWIGYRDGYHTFYTGTVEARPELDTQVLSWSTKDFILYDKPNGCYISIEGTFVGTQFYGGTGTGHTKVELKIVTPAGTAVQTLFETDSGYGELLEEVDIGGGVMAVPSPQLRLMFTPMFQEQGDFKGGAYTIQSEIDNGAAPAYLFNFVLELDMYPSVGTDVTDEASIHFIPCNLLEMLYAYVFSTKAGVDDYQRYPVEFVTRYNNFVAGIFSPQFPVFYRDGTATDWTTAFGDSHLTEQTQELYRV